MNRRPTKRPCRFWRICAGDPVRGHMERYMVDITVRIRGNDIGRGDNSSIFYL